MTSSIDLSRLSSALEEVLDLCSEETYNVLTSYIKDLEDEVNSLSIEIDSIDTRQKKRRRNDADWN